MPRSFGPNVHHNDDGSFRATCNWCTFRHWHDGDGHICTLNHRSPRRIEDINDTPDWCEMKAGMLRDARAAAGR